MKQALLNIIFPKTCIFCRKQGTWLCEDCFSLIEINPFQFCICGKTKEKYKCEYCFSNLDGLFVCTRQNQKIVDKIIDSYSKIKDLFLSLSLIILTHFLLLKKTAFNEFVIYPLPQNKKEIRRTGFNKTETMAEIISQKLKIPLIKNPEEIKNKKVLLFDIIYSDKMESLAKQLKPSQVFGLVIKKH